MIDRLISKRLDEIFSSAPSSQSIQFLQSALSEYVEIDLVGAYDQAAIEMKRCIGIEISRHTIRRFATNDSGDDENEGYPSTPRRRRQFAEFLSLKKIIDPENLVKGEFSSSQAALRLADFFSTNDLQICHGYTGTFAFNLNQKRPDYQYLVELNFLQVKGSHILSVSERSFLSVDHRLNWSENRDHAKPALSFQGWGVFEKPDVLILFLQGSIHEDGKKTYFSIKSPQRYVGTRNVSSIFLYNRNHSLETSAANFEKDRIDHLGLPPISMEFQRVDDFSRKKSQGVDIMSDNLTDAERKKRQKDLKKKRLARNLFVDERSQVTEDNKEQEERVVMEDEFEKPDPQEILGKRLFQAAQYLDESKVRELVEQGAPINYVDLQTGATAIFPLAVHEQWDAVQYLLDTGECDLLIRNSMGRLLSTRIGEETGNMAWASKIRALEVEQGKKVGILPRMRGDEPIESSPDLD